LRNSSAQGRSASQIGENQHQSGEPLGTSEILVRVDSGWYVRDAGDNMQSLEISSGEGRTFPAYLASPEAGEGCGVLVVSWPTASRRQLCDVAEVYRRAGFLVLVADVFASSTHDGRGLRAEFDRDSIESILDFSVQDVTTGFEMLSGLPAVTGTCGIVGYCLGGQLACRAATIVPSDATVAFYPAGIDRHLGIAENLQTPVLFHYAEADMRISHLAITATRYAFARHHYAWFRRYRGVSHGFCWEGHPGFDLRAATKAHECTLNFLRTHLLS